MTSDLGEGEIPRFELEPNQNQLQIEFFGLGEGPGTSSGINIGSKAPTRTGMR